MIKLRREALKNIQKFIYIDAAIYGDRFVFFSRAPSVGRFVNLKKAKQV